MVGTPFKGMLKTMGLTAGVGEERGVRREGGKKRWKEREGGGPGKEEGGYFAIQRLVFQ